jgi:hypothetical protein
MTKSKAAETDAAGTPSKTVATTSTADDHPLAEPVHDDQNPLLEQLVALTRSISELARRESIGSGGQPPTTPGSTASEIADAAQRARVVFAYDFLGVVLGRRAPSVFQLPAVEVDREPGFLTFTNLKGATVAKVRAANNTVRVLENLQDGGRVRIDDGPDAIADGQRIDSIVIFKSVDGVLVPVALGPCLSPKFLVVG